MYRVYIADDAALVRKELVLTTPWDELGCVVVGQAEEGRTALRQISELKPDIVITDIKMPYLNGLELIHELRARGCEAEFILISAYGEFEYALNAIKLEVLDYILKPISDEELMQTLRKTIRRIRDKKKSSRRAEQFSFDTGNLNAHLRNAIAYIRGHYREDLTIRDVAAALHISESYLGKLFKTEINTTFVEYVTRVRIYESLELLKDKNIPIYNIAEQVGYRDYRYYGMVFKKLMGITPKEYQKKS